MIHALHCVTDFKVIGPYRLRVSFRDGTVQEIDFQPVLAGLLFGPLRDPELFNQVRLDQEVHTLVWPNGADFDPATLHDWQKMLPAMSERARAWEASSTPNQAMQRTAEGRR
ncbi:MAG: DUF2442 domain-containing protein [Pirellulales bacterium]